MKQSDILAAIMVDPMTANALRIVGRAAAQIAGDLLSGRRTVALARQDGEVPLGPSAYAFLENGGLRSSFDVGEDAFWRGCALNVYGHRLPDTALAALVGMDLSVTIRHDLIVPGLVVRRFEEDASAGLYQFVVDFDEQPVILA